MTTPLSLSPPHPLPLWKNLLVFAALMALLALTVVGHLLHWGTVAALGIAVCKALLVALYFMHLRFSSRLIQIVPCAAIFWLAIMFLLTLNDYVSRGWVPLSGK